MKQEKYGGGEQKGTEGKMFTLDLSEAWDTESQIEVFFEKLKAAGLYKEGLLYRGASMKEIESLKPGQAIYCSEEEDVKEPTNALSAGVNALEFVIEDEGRVMLLLDQSKLITKGGHRYILDKGVSYNDAIIAILHLKF